MLYLQRSRTASDGHPLEGVFSDYRNPVHVFLDRQKAPVVLKEDDTCSTNFSGGLIMLIRA